MQSPDSKRSCSKLHKRHKSRSVRGQSSGNTSHSGMLPVTSGRAGSDTHDTLEAWKVF